MRELPAAFVTPEAKRRYVRRLFATIADRYDFITVILSYGMDQRWKRRLIADAQVGAGDRVVDLACGTGDIAIRAAWKRATVIGLDITPRMIELARAKAKLLARHDGLWPVPSFAVADMTAIPLPDACVDVVTTGYGLRNVPVLEHALDEIARVLKPGGRLASLDFNRPGFAPIRTAYLGYLTVVGASLGWALHRDPDTYRYIPESIRRYPEASGVATLLSARGFAPVKVRPLLGGLMALHVATKAQ